MTIYPSTKVMPYVYRLDDPITGEFYFGFRKANKVPSSSDLGIKYFTSSKYVKPRFAEFTITILAEFFNAKDAFEFEQHLIKEHVKIQGILNRRYYETDTFKMMTLSGKDNPNFGNKWNDDQRAAASLKQTGINKGLTYEEMYGEEKAFQLKLDRSTKTREFRKLNPLSLKGERNPRALKIQAISPEGKEFIIVGGIVGFCKEHDLGISKVTDCYLRNEPHFKGWQFQILQADLS